MKKIYEINSYKWIRIRLIFVYGADYTRQFNRVNVYHLWEEVDVWVWCSVLFASATALYYLRRLAGIRQVDFMVGFLEVFSIAFGGGNIRYRHQWDRIFFGIGSLASLILVSIYIADFEMETITHHGAQKIDTIDKLAERNITFKMSGTLKPHKADITEMLR